MRFITLVHCEACGAEIPRGHATEAPPEDLLKPCVICGGPDVRLLHTMAERKRHSLGVAAPSEQETRLRQLEL